MSFNDSFFLKKKIERGVNEVSWNKIEFYNLDSNKFIQLKSCKNDSDLNFALWNFFNDFFLRKFQFLVLFLKLYFN